MIVDESFPSYTCFKRIIIIKNVPPRESDGVMLRHVRKLMRVESSVVNMIQASFAENQVQAASRYVERTFINDLDMAKADTRHIEAYLERNILGADLSEREVNYALDQMLILSESVLIDGVDYYCVALDELNFPLYWISCLVNTQLNIFEVCGFARSMIGTLQPRPGGRGCGAPFLSFVIDRMMHQVMPTDAFKCFFVTALEGTRKTLAKLEGRPQARNLHLVKSVELPEDIETFIKDFWFPMDVYCPSEAFFNAWKEVEKEKKMRIKNFI